MQKVSNTLTQKKEVLKPFDNAQGKKLRLFVCGPTVYDFSHLGHARTYIAFDMIVKYLKTKGYDVFYLQNITDIDDKIINRAKEKGVLPKKLALEFEKEYLKDMRGLKITSITKYARATDHIKEIISQVDRLLKKGFAYRIEDGIYYDISKFKNYGKLSRRTALQAEDSVSRIDDSVGKRNRGDFCLWKFSKTGEPSWPSVWGSGRPGWHIEDTAITEKYFGPQYDIHGGARDLIFPHHEAEIAQMEAISGKKPLVRYWLHTGFLTINGQKMSKSLGNFITIRDFLKNNSFRLLRLFVLKNHYRSPIDYTENEINAVKSQLERIDELIDKLQITNYKLQANSKFQIAKYEKEFYSAMDDDFNTPKALSIIFELINKTNSLISQNKLTKQGAKDILEFLKKIDGFFGFIFEGRTKEKIPEVVLKLSKEREKYRKEDLWKKADEAREKIKKFGYLIEDTKAGSKIKKI
ncbi:MAG: cysteine--tRNA ligase [Candidatus Pacebacteria bacterium]|nr:cysteine--tRNA ligase [Candidatus Paceibacterota bacterium]